MAALLAAGCAQMAETPGPAVDPGVRQLLAPGGKMRVGVNVANPALARRDDRGR
jgi:hypothetical protein